MSGFGKFQPWPFQFGGATRPIESEHNALRENLSPDRKGYNVDDDLIDVEVYAHATALAQIWAANKRSQNQALPLRMLEELRNWETVLQLRPGPADSDQSRREAVAAKLRGMAGNALVDIEATAREVLGANYVGVQTTDAAEQITYWPGVNPGPPGYEWSSNRCVVRIEMTRVGLSDDEFYAKVSRLNEKLDAMLRSDMTFTIFVGNEGTGFRVGISGVGVTEL